jgi:hypothetical protein
MTSGKRTGSDATRDELDSYFNHARMLAIRAMLVEITDYLNRRRTVTMVWESLRHFVAVGLERAPCVV